MYGAEASKKNAIESHPLKKKNHSWCASSVMSPAPSLIQFARGSSWYHFHPEGEQVSARPRFGFLTCVAHDVRRQWFQLIFWGPHRPMGFFLKNDSPMYFFNHIIYIYIISIIVYFIETYIYIITTSHMLLTYKNNFLTIKYSIFLATKILVIVYKSLVRFKDQCNI